MFKKTLVTVMAVALAVIMSVSAFADFTPSVVVKPAPTIDYVSIWNNNIELSEVPSGEIIVTPYAERNSAPNATIKAALENAYKDLNEKKLDVLAPGIMDAAKKYSSSIKVSDLIVRDLFDVSVIGDTAAALAKVGNTIRIRFDLDLVAGALLIPIHFIGNTWEVVDAIDFNSDGSVTVEFDSLSPIAFITTTASPDVPPTGDMPLWATILMASVGVCGAAIIVVAVISKKRAVA